MARHAGFGAVVSVTQNLVNDVLSTVAGNTPSLSFDVPNIAVGGAVVTVSGSLTLLAPTVTLHERADNLVTVALSLQAILNFSAQAAGNQTASVVLATSADVPLGAVVVNGKVFGVLDLAQISITQLSVTSASPPLTPMFQSAVASQSFLSAVTNGLRQLSLLSTPPLMSSTINQPVSRGEPPPPASIFPPYPTRFTVSLSLGKIVVKPFDAAMTIAADFDGVTSGDPTQIVNLLTAFSPLITYTENVNGDVSGGYTQAGVDPHANLVMLINATVVSNVLSTQVSPGFDRGPCVGDRAIVHSVSATMGWFDAGAPWGTGYGLTITADASAYAKISVDPDGYHWPASALHVPATVTIFVRMTAVNPQSHPAYWMLQVVNGTVSLPDWLPITLLIPVLCGAIVVPIFAIIAGVVLRLIPTVLSNLLEAAETQIFQAGTSAFTAANTLALQTPFFSGATWTQDIWTTGFTSEGPEAQVELYNPVRVASLRKNLALRGMNATGRLRTTAPGVKSVRVLMGS